VAIKEAIQIINRMEADGVIERYAIGGAVGATFYLEPVATLDVGVFVEFRAEPGSRPVSLEPIFTYLRDRDCTMEGEHIVIAARRRINLTSNLTCRAVADAKAETSNIKHRRVRGIRPIFLHPHSAPGIRQRAEIRRHLQKGKIKNVATGCRHNSRENYELIYRSESGHRRGDGFGRFDRGRYGPGVAKACPSFLIETRRHPGSLAPTLVTLPSMSRVPRAPFLLLPFSFLLSLPRIAAPG